MTGDRAVLKLLAGVRAGDPTRHQCDPDEKDPVLGETAAEAWETYERTGMVNPLHARALQAMQNEARAKRVCQNPACDNPVGPQGKGATSDGRFCGLVCAMEAKE